MKFAAYPEYRAADTEWHDEIPAKWKSLALGRMFRRVKRTGFPGEVLLSVYRDYGVIPKSSRDDNHNKPSEDLSPYQLVKAGDLVMNKMKAWQGSIAMSEYQGIVSPAYFVYKPRLQNDERIAARYVHYLLRSPIYVTQYLSRSKGIRVSQWDLDPESFDRIEVLLPTLAEQQQIASFLDYETAKIDALIEKQQQLIAVLGEKRQAVISHAVTKGLNPDAPMRDSGVESLGEVPEHWKVTKIKHVATGFMYGTSEDCNTEDAGVPVLRIPNIKDCVLDYLDLKYAKFSPQVETRYLLKHNDILVVRTNGNPDLVGKSAIFKGDRKCMFASYLIKIRPTKRVSAQFLIVVLNAPCTREMLTHTARTSAGNYNMNCEGLGGTSLPLPPMNEQVQIAEYVHQRVTEFDSLEEKAQQAVDLLQERRTALISAAVTGKIDVRGWKRPPSEVEHEPEMEVE